MDYQRKFEDAPANMVEKHAYLKDYKTGKVIIDRMVEAPEGWSDRAVTVAVDKYFHGDKDKDIEGLVKRIAYHISKMVNGNGGIYKDVKRLLLSQKAAFNSPVWFNVGIGPSYGVKGSAVGWRWFDGPDVGVPQAVPCDDAYRYPQGSACFIISVDDDMNSIMDVAKAEAMLFKYGSGVGKNVSTIRSSREYLSNGFGRPSGPLSFMKVYDAGAAVVKSGGLVRRAAKLECMNFDHPDIQQFIDCKWKEEEKAKALVAAGFSDGMDGEAYDSVWYQNSNISVRVSDAFMQQAIDGGSYHTKAVTTGEDIEELNARDVLMKIAEATWKCGDPGVQFDDTTNSWHTCPNSGRINASNPCGEFVFLDNSACNLASINLIKYLNDDNTFDLEGFRLAIETLIKAQEALVDGCSYPTKEIAQNSHDFRPLGLGYCNLGGLLMALGIPYDSDEGRDLAAAITSYMTAVAYKQSALIAKEIGPFPRFEENREAMMTVIVRHFEASGKLYENAGSGTLAESIAGYACCEVWCDAEELGEQYGYRNSQVTLLAPTGTIGLVMDADTTGIEPALSLVSYKTLAGGGSIKIVNRLVERALKTLGYSDRDRNEILDWIDRTGTVDGSAYIKKEHLPVFQTAIGKNALDPMAHIKMMAAVQPFLSGAISKTVNLPKESTPEDIFNIYVEAWRLGLKSVAVYRDGSKAFQPLSDKDKKEDKTPFERFMDEECEVHEDFDDWIQAINEHAGISGECDAVIPLKDGRSLKVECDNHPQRKRLPDTRESITHKFSIGGHEGYLTVGLFENGQPGELFVTMSKEGSTIAGLLGNFMTSVSLNLQYGCPLEKLCQKFRNTKFEPHGWSGDQDIGYAHSISDYLFRWLENRFVKTNGKAHEVAEKIEWQEHEPIDDDGERCRNCGGKTQRAGACHVCMKCGETTGCG